MPALRATRPSPAARCLARPGPGALALRITARGLAALGVGTGTSPDVAVTSGATISYALETDWPVEAAGFDPLHSGIEIRQDSQPGAAGFETLHLEIRSAEPHPASTGFRRRSGAPLIRDAQVRVPPPGLRVLANSGKFRTKLVDIAAGNSEAGLPIFHKRNCGSCRASAM
jgi:hypothetical protein